MFKKIEEIMLKKVEVRIWQLLIGTVGIFAASGIVETVSAAIILILVGSYAIIYDNPKTNVLYNNFQGVEGKKSFPVIDEKDFKDACVGYGYENIVRRNTQGNIEFYKDLTEDQSVFQGKCERLRRRLTYIKAKELNTTMADVQPVVYTINGEGALFQL